MINVFLIRSWKKILAVLFGIFFLQNTTLAQQVLPQLLKEPASWPFERFALPPVFAPDFPYKGAEELRFSPGMFNKDSADYFTYAFVAQLDNTVTVSREDISNYLFNYFKKLCSSTANQRKLVIDTSKIAVYVKKQEGAPGNDLYDATLDVFGVFTDGAPVKLNMEIKVLMNAPAKKIYLVFIASPREKSNRVWKELYKIQKEFAVPATS